MATIMSVFRRALASTRERGAATIEYAGLAVVVTVVIAGLVAVPWNSLLSSGLGSTVCTIFSQTASGPTGDSDVDEGETTVLAAGADLAGSLPAAATEDPTPRVLAGDCPLTRSADGEGGGGSDGSDPFPAKPDEGGDSGGGGSKDPGPDAGDPGDSGEDVSDSGGTDDSAADDSGGEGSPEDSDRPESLPAGAEPTDHSVDGYDGPFYIDDDGQIYDGSGEKIPNTKPGDRPSYAPDQVEKVWERSREQQIEDYEDGVLEDVNNEPPPHAPKKDSMWVLDKNGEWREITWKPGDSRRGVWDMGHLPGNEYRKLHDQYINGEISREEFLEEYRDPENYQVEDPGRNRSHQDEEPH